MKSQQMQTDASKPYRWLLDTTNHIALCQVQKMYKLESRMEWRMSCPDQNKMNNSLHGMYTLGVVNTFRGDFMPMQNVFEWLTNGKIRESIQQTYLPWKRFLPKHLFFQWH